MTGLDWIIMLLITGFLAWVLAGRAKLHPAGKHDFFFDLKNTKAMRGFWCLVVVLIHMPADYQNGIQRLIGNFAFAGVTFFFMTSAFGLSEGLKRNPDMLRSFWRRRLPRLLGPNWLGNLAFAVPLWLFFGRRFRITTVLKINIWVAWLLVCLLLFWLAAVCFRNAKVRDAVICIAIFVVSITMHFLQRAGYIPFIVWSTEMLGFAGGILLSRFLPFFRRMGRERWLARLAGLGACTLVLGLVYMKYKPVFFWGDYLLELLLWFAIVSVTLLLNTRVSIGNRVSLFLGEISFEVFLIHGNVFALVHSAFPGLGSGLFILMSIAVTVVGAVIIHWISKQTITVLDRILKPAQR